MTTDNTSTPTPPDHVSTEERILQAAEEEFLAKGFDGARTIAIAQRADVTHAMLHYYYRTKQKLFEIVVSEKLSDISEILFGIFGAEDVSFLERVKLGVERHFDFIASNPNLPLFLLMELNRNPERIKSVLTPNTEKAGKMLALLQREIDINAAAGLCQPIDAMMLLSDILSLNIMSVMGLPIIATLYDGVGQNAERFIADRRKEVVKTIMTRLKP